jgi:hypothetical protein
VFLSFADINNIARGISGYSFLEAQKKKRTQTPRIVVAIATFLSLA